MTLLRSGRQCYAALLTDIPQRGRHITLFVKPAIFTQKKVTQDSRLEAISVLNRWKGCQMQGGRRSHSGAMMTDDNEADGALSGEAGETSFQP